MAEQPKQLGGAPKEPVIYTIPEQFYGLAAKAHLPKEAAAPAAPAAAAPSAPAAPAPEKGSKAWILIPIIALLLVVGLGFGAWYLLKPKPAPAPAQPSVTLPTTPAPQPEPEPVPEPEPEPVPEPATSTEATPAAPSADADADGLSAAEEALFGTDERKSDSDDDGFSDSVEVTNLYNPAGFRPTRLVEAGQVVSRGSAAGALLALVPTAWALEPAPAEGDGLAVRDAAFGDVFSALRQENAEGQSLLDWYLSRNPGVSASQIQQATTKSGLDLLRGPDENGVAAAYVDLGAGAIYRLTYAQGSEGQVYRAAFTMFVNSVSARP